MIKTINLRTKISANEVALFSFFWSIVGIISAFDFYISVLTYETLYEAELNPLGRWLIWIDHESIALFMSVKFLGGTFVLGATPFFLFIKRWWAFSIIIPLAIFQLFVFYVLVAA